MNEKAKSGGPGQAQSTTLAEVAPVKMKKGLSSAMAASYGMDRSQFLKTIKATCFPDSGKSVTNEQLAAFLIVANEYGLNPFIRQIYAFPSKGGGIVPIVPVDGWSRVVNENKKYDGCKFLDVFKDGKIFSTTCQMFRKDRGHPIEVTEYLGECYRKTDPWTRWPARMLRHKAFIQAARLAFGLSGIYDPDEAERIEDVDVEIISTRTPEEIKADADAVDNAAADAKPEKKTKPKPEKTAEVKAEEEPEPQPGRESAPPLEMEQPAKDSPTAEQPPPAEAEDDDDEEEGWV